MELSLQANEAYQRGLRLYAAHDYAQAIAEFERMSGDTAQKTFCIATCLMEQGDEAALCTSLDAFCRIFDGCAKTNEQLPYGVQANAVAAATKLCALLEGSGRWGSQCLEVLLRVRVYVHNHAVLDYNIGRQYELLGRPKLAIRYLEQTLADGSMDTNPDLWVELAKSHAQLGQNSLAHRTLLEGLKSVPTGPTNGRAALLRELGNTIAAEGGHTPSAASLLKAIGVYQEGLGLLPAVGPCPSDQALDLLCGLHMNLGNCYLKLADIDRALEEYQVAIKANPNDPSAIHNLGGGLLYAPDVPEQTTFFTMSGLGRRLAKMAGVPAQHPANSQWPSLRPLSAPVTRPVRVGYISPDLLAFSGLSTHPVAKFARAMLGHFDPAVLQVHCYDTRMHSQNVLAQAALAVASKLYHPSISWHTLRNLSTEQAKDLLLSHQLDVLVDLAGYTDGNRADVYAHRVAPVQIGHIGFPFHTGLANQDWLVCDGVMLPQAPGMVEKALLLPGCYLHWPLTEPELPALDRSPGPHKRTYICLNKPNKVNPRVRRLFAKLLKSDLEAGLIVKTQHIAELICKEHNIEPGRVSAPPATPAYADFLQLYNRADVALDTFPWTGTTTTCEALSMGTPVVTLCPPEDAPYHQRSSASLLYHTGLSAECVAESEGDYVQRCRALPEATQASKKALRDKFLASNVCDKPEKYAKKWSEALLKLCSPGRK